MDDRMSAGYRSAKLTPEYIDGTASPVVNVYT